MNISENIVKISLKEHQVYGHFPVEKKLGILVVDDHQLILTGTLDILSREYPEADIIKAQTGKDILDQLQFYKKFDLIVMDLSIPNQQGETAEIDTGIKLLQTLLKEYTHQNFLVQSSYVKALIRIKHEIDNHQGGFAIADKALPENEMLMRVNLALNGATHTKEIKTAIELKPEWLDVLRLAFEESLTDKAIAEKIGGEQLAHVLQSNSNIIGIEKFYHLEKFYHRSVCHLNELDLSIYLMMRIAKIDVIYCIHRILKISMKINIL